LFSVGLIIILLNNYKMK